MRALLFTIVVAALFLAPLSLQAADACDAAKLKADIQAELDRFEENLLGAIRSIIDLALDGLLDCSELEDHYSFSDLEGAQPVLGPLALSQGLYIITMSTEGSARVEGVALDGCGKELNGVIHNFSVGQGIRGAANLVEVEIDCVFYLELSKITAFWTLTINKASGP